MKNQVKWSLTPGYVYDGEVFWKHLRYTHSILSGPEPIKKLYYYVFDTYPLEYCSKICPLLLIQRKIMLKRNFQKLGKSKWIVQLPYRNVKVSPTKFKDLVFKLVDEYVLKGWEGIILKHRRSPYIHDRTKLWWKVKKFFSLDLRCINVVESKKRPGILGGIVVDACGTPAIVGTGFTLNQRIYFWNHPDEIIGKIVEVRYFERLPSGKLRFPIFVRIRDDKDKPDC